MPEMSEVPNSGLKITALSLSDAAKVLAKTCGRNVTVDDLRAHVAQGAPLNPDGTMNLVAFAAWLVMEVAHGD